jgi:prepilin-type processing-associated H-X9-DG protein
MKASNTECRAGTGQNARRLFRGGFTLVELLVVAGTVALLLMVVTPAFSRMKPNGYAVQCQNNTRQLAMAWQMYADDNSGKLVVNLHGGANAGGAGDSFYGQNWASGWLDWASSTDNTNIAFLTDPRYARLAPYLNSATNVFKCPADKYLSSAQRTFGWTQRARSYSASIYLGAGNAELGPVDSIYKHVIKTSDLLYPTPAQTWVHVDEHPDSINDPAFFSPRQAAWIDNPATYHNGAAGFSFADGHSEMHKWSGSLTRLTSVGFYFSSISALPGDPDIHWVSLHSQRISANSY